MENILELQQVSKTFPKSNFTLENVTFSLPYGAILGFVGENGAGKTTTIGCILNTITKDSGTVKLFGQEMLDADTSLREKIGVVYDGDNFPAYWTAKQLSEVMEGLYTQWDNSLFQKYLEDFHLPAKQKIKHYSRGMTMKLAIAAALAHHPELLILDEATSGLDPIMRDEMLDVFLEFVQEENHSILLSSHITSDLEKVADYITFIHNGKLIMTVCKMDLDIQVSKLKLMKANHTSQKYRLEDNITKHYPQQITILKERISGMQADIQTAKENLPADKEQFTMKVGDKLYTDKKEAGTALVEMCKEIKSVNAPAMIGEYAGFKMSVSFDSFNHKFVMNVKGQLSHNLEIGSDPLGNIARINHALESMTKELAEAKTKLDNVEHQLETAKVEVQKPFAQEVELAEKLDRLSALNALLNMDEKGDDGIGMDDELEVLKSEKEVADRQAKNVQIAEKIVNIAKDKDFRQYVDAPSARVSLKAKLEAMKEKVVGEDTEKFMSQKVKRKEEIL